MGTPIAIVPVIPGRLAPITPDKGWESLSFPITFTCVLRTAPPVERIETSERWA
jgi:hypothetical protein